MTRLDELTLKLIDSELSAPEAAELVAVLGQGRGAVEAHVRLVEIEASLRGRRTNLQFAETTMARLRTHLVGTLTQRVMAEVKAVADRSADAHIRAAHTTADRLADVGIRAPKPRRLSSACQFHRIVRLPSVLLGWRVRLALATCVTLLAGLSIWFFGPTMGEPVLAALNGMDVSIERGTEFIPAANGMALKPADVLRLGTNASATIAFGAEKTRLELAAGTDLKFLNWERGKHFMLQAGLIEASVTRQRPFHPMTIITPYTEARVVGTEFSLEATTNEIRLEVAQGQVRFTLLSDAKSSVQVRAGHYAVAAANSELSALPLTGRILREYWTNLPGDYFVTFLTSHPDFPDRPSGREYLDKFEGPSHWGKNYGARIRGYLHPPLTGTYTFWIAAGDGGEFFLSPDDKPESKVQLGYANGTALHEWTKDRSQQSSAVTLSAGRKYYIEALQKQGKGDDHLAVAWKGPDREREVIPGEYLSPPESKTKGKKR